MDSSSTVNIDDFENRVVPITYLRRHLGEVFENLPKSGSIFIRKGNTIIAELKPRTKKQPKKGKTTAEKLLELAGAWGDMTPEEDAIWKEVLNNKDTKPPVDL